MFMFRLLLFSLLVLVLGACECSAQGTIFTARPFTSYSGYGSTIRYSPATATGLYTRRTVVFQGISSNGTAITLQGTAALQCAPVASGPWQTCKDVNGNAVSTTNNAIFTVEDLTQYVRAAWTRTKQRVSVWMFYSEANK